LICPFVDYNPLYRHFPFWLPLLWRGAGGEDKDNTYCRLHVVLLRKLFSILAPLSFGEGPGVRSYRDILIYNDTRLASSPSKRAGERKKTKKLQGITLPVSIG
jgi:hypothetical protein